MKKLVVLVAWVLAAAAALAPAAAAATGWTEVGVPSGNSVELLRASAARTATAGRLTRAARSPASCLAAATFPGAAQEWAVGVSGGNQGLVLGHG
ncbi:MAG TPA: hypothetical protein VMF57_12040 [Solirubrobacteraceae bacterium]|nr:hypothetical protein [Solirubrobacteraceae bacterium]